MSDTEQSLLEAMLEAMLKIKRDMPILKLSPTHIVVPHEAVVREAERQGVSLDDARKLIREKHKKLLRGS